jgi:monoamine oxidase
MLNEYDTRIAIVGAGIAGLSTAYNLISQGYNGSINIFERSDHAGGRLVSDVMKGGDEVVEFGAGRFNIHSHKSVDTLGRELGLDVAPFSYSALYGYPHAMKQAKENGRDFAAIVASLKNEVSRYTSGNFTRFANEVIKPDGLTKIVAQAGYDTLLNPHLPPPAGIAILSDHPESQSYLNGSTEGWFKFKSGFHGLVSGLEERLKDRVNFFYGSDLQHVSVDGDDASPTLTLQQGGRTAQVAFDATVIAMPLHATQKISGMEKYPSIGNYPDIEDVPLIKGFVKFDRNWWNALGIGDRCIVRDSGLRKLYLPKNSNIMWFYCDGKSALDAVDRISYKDFSIAKEIENHLKCQIPSNAKVDDFSWKFWARGISFFKNQNNENLSRNFGIATKNLIICSDIYTDHLGWIEGGIASSKAASRHMLNIS